jgi:hypothetical protein
MVDVGSPACRRGISTCEFDRLVFGEAGGVAEGLVDVGRHEVGIAFCARF